MKLPINNFTTSIAQRVQQIRLWVSLGSNFSAETIAPSGYAWEWLAKGIDYPLNSVRKALS